MNKVPWSNLRIKEYKIEHHTCNQSRVYSIPHMAAYRDTVVKKETFCPETGPEFPSNDKNLKLFGTLIQWCKNDLPNISRKNYFACFRAESSFFEHCISATHNTPGRISYSSPGHIQRKLILCIFYKYFIEIFILFLLCAFYNSCKANLNSVILDNCAL